MEFVPVVEDSVWALAPGFRALSLRVQRDPDVLAAEGVGQSALDEAVQLVLAGGPAWADDHLMAWHEVFRSFGAKPQRTPSSAQSLRDRLLKHSGMGSINPVVDLYNAISLKFAVPVGGENLAAYKGAPCLNRANGTEIFDTVKNGEAAVESPEAGEVIWRDAIGVTCRRWNWRQGLRTRLDEAAHDMWFVLESLPAMPLSALEQAGAELEAGLTQLFAPIQSDTRLLRRG